MENILRKLLLKGAIPSFIFKKLFKLHMNSFGEDKIAHFRKYLKQRKEFEKGVYTKTQRDSWEILYEECKKKMSEM